MQLPLNVNLNGQNLSAITDLDITLNIEDAQMQNLQAYLTPPWEQTEDLNLAATPLHSFSTTTLTSTVAVTGITPALAEGLHNGGQGLGTITNLINNETIGTVFDDQAIRKITDPNQQAPYVGHFQPEAIQGPIWDPVAIKYDPPPDGSGNAYLGIPTLPNIASLYQGRPITSLEGTWTLTITDYYPVIPVNSPQNVLNWSLHFTGIAAGFTSAPLAAPNLPIGVGVTTVNGVVNTNVKTFGTVGAVGGAATAGASPTNAYPLVTLASGLSGFGLVGSGTPGIGPGVSIAQDKTLGSFSPYEGRIYVSFTDGGGQNIYVASSDDGGTTWNTAVKVNNDTAADNFSEGDRPEFNPEITVDPLTGEVVVIWYDGRYDASMSRVANSVAVSNDGGQTWSTNSYLNVLTTATNALTGAATTIAPIPGSQTATNSNGNISAKYGFGDRSGVVAYGGRITPVFSTNLNSTGDAVNGPNQDITTDTVVTAGGPRVIYGDMGPVTSGPPPIPSPAR